MARRRQQVGHRRQQVGHRRQQVGHRKQRGSTRKQRVSTRKQRGSHRRRVKRGLEVEMGGSHYTVPGLQEFMVRSNIIKKKLQTSSRIQLCIR